MRSVEEGRGRVVIESVEPQVNGGRFPIKRVIGEKVSVQADIYADGHDEISCVLLYRPEQEATWTEMPMELLDNDRWRGDFSVRAIGNYRYTLEAWVDPFKTWRRDLLKKIAAGQDVEFELLTGAALLDEARELANGADAQRLKASATALRSTTPDRAARAIDDEIARTIQRYPRKRFATRYKRELGVVVDREKARFSSWYEMFPRSCSRQPGKHGTFKDCEDRLPYVAGMGFDILYLPPIHPIGRSHRKGRNNSIVAEVNDPGSPWAIGSAEGGHTAIHPQLGSLEDFKKLIAKAKQYGMEIALDVAFQCTPDHPYVKEHPDWFRHRPDGSIQYAENPPKKYQDIYPLDFECDDWRALWEELKNVVLFWVEQGVRILRIDNPHTKPFKFWEWLIAEIRMSYPDVILLSEAFTRPKIMLRLAKVGFTQSYTYFAWRNTKGELTQYFTELNQTPVREYFRPNLWPNTPDILTEYLQFGGRPAFLTRLILAATLGANYGIYGPAFELWENQAREPGSEEYLNSEKYEIKHWDLEKADSLKDLITRVNQIRKNNRALHSDWSLRFYPTDNEQILCYAKRTEDLENIIIVVVNLDPYHIQAGWLELSLQDFALDPDQPFQVHELLTDAHYLWHGARNYVELNPHNVPAHILQVRRRVRSEKDFDYFM